jgi:hypothetical protein
VKTATISRDTSNNSRNSKLIIGNSSRDNRNITDINSRRRPATVEMPEKVKMPTTVPTSAGTPTAEYGCEQPHFKASFNSRSGPMNLAIGLIHTGKRGGELYVEKVDGRKFTRG